MYLTSKGGSSCVISVNFSCVIFEGLFNIIGITDKASLKCKYRATYNDSESGRCCNESM